MPERFQYSRFDVDQLLRKDSDNIYRLEPLRIESFKNWSNLWIQPEKLTAAGFYYTGEEDKVQCFECEIGLFKWKENNDPIDEHKQWSPTCRFIRGFPCGNVLIGIGPAIPIMPKREDVCESRNSSKKSSSSSSPKHPKYATYDARLASFAMWLKVLKHLKEKLAAAGLFYTGQNDQTVCYQCGVELNDWAANDDPMDKHKRLSPTCRFIRDGPCDNFPIGIGPAIPIVPKRKDVCESRNSPKKSSSSSSPKHPKYATYDARLASFAMWLKVLKHLKEKLAAAGLFYTGQNDQTVCYQCGVELNDWAANDDPMDKHKRLSPTCRFIRDGPCDNFPIGVGPAIPIVPKREDVYESRNSSKKSSSSSPKHPKYATYDARLASFAMWLKVLKHLKEKLAAAGLFYTGQNDQTVCYQCGVELNDWAANDDPMDKHKRLSPTCRFIRDGPCDNFPIGIGPAIPIVPKRKDVCESRNSPKKSSSSSSPKHPKYAIYDARLASFAMWLKILKHLKEILAAAGLFYTLNDWAANDDPMDKHKRLSPTCRFIRDGPCDNFPIGIGPAIPIVPKRKDVCESRNSPKKSSSSSSPKHPKYAIYDARLASFAMWLKILKHLKEILAAASLFYTGQNDQTVCYQCGVELNDWAANDDPMDKHKRLSPTCKFIRDGPCDNFPIGIGPAIPIVPKRKDVCESRNSPKKSSSSSSPKHPKYATYDARLASFAMWLKVLKHLKEKLAAAGLFYTGQNDQTVCYQCGVELNDWAANDDPMDKHKRLSPTCRFIRDGPCDNFPIGIGPAIPIVPKREDVYESHNSPKKSSSSSPKHPKYATYDARLASFAMWLKVLKHLKEKLAAAGLFYTGQNDQTVCYQCGVELNDWAANDDPMDKHKRLSPTCRFIRDGPCDNFPIGIGPAIPIVPKREDVCESRNSPKKSSSSSSPKHPKYATYDARLASFAMWLKVLKHLKEKLAAAGLFYTGQNDQTVCYQCGVELNDWAANDDPMDKHKRLSPTCRFIHDGPCDNFPIGIGPAIPIVPKREDVYESRNLPKKSSSSSPKHPKYATYDARLASFAMWLKVLKHLKEKLAAAGLFYTGQNDQTVCYQCGVELNDWAANDDPMDKHKRLSPTCRFIRDGPCDNFPIGIGPAIPIVPKREDVCESRNSPKKSSSSSNPKHPKYATYDARLASFAMWLKVLKHLKEKLAAAGLFYTGQNDQTVCYQCGVELNDWAANDDPMDKHKRLSPTCRFIHDGPCDNFPIGIGPAIPIVPKREDVYESRNLPKKSSSLSPKHPKYATYDARLASFAMWLKVLKHLKEKLAAAGLFYTGQNDQTVCYQCGVELNDWAANDDPMDKHKRLSPTCRFIRDDPCNNFPIGIGLAIPIVPKGEDVCESRNSPKKSSSSSSPKHPKYATYDARLASFAMWLKVLKHLKEKLAAAGLFYTGQNDQTVCYQCGVELNDWAANDDPMDKHKRLSPTCRFIRDGPCDNFPIRISPKHPKYATYDARLASFAMWSRVLSHLNETLAAAGLFYTGQSDRTECHQCGIELKDWAADDNPWQKHVQSSGDCPYLPKQIRAIFKRV